MEPGKSVGYCTDPFDEEGDGILELSERYKGMRKMGKKNEKKFPGIVADSIRCQSYHIARCERCNGCDFAINGCEKVFEMSAG